MSVESIPKGYEKVVAYLLVHDAVEAIQFYKKAFNATELMCMSLPNQKIAHAELQIEQSIVMLADECPDVEMKNPQQLQGTSVGLMFYVEDIDVRFEQAIAAGARVLRPVQDQFYGDRSGTLVDPYGHIWTIAKHIEDVSPEEMENRMKEMMS